MIDYSESLIKLDAMRHQYQKLVSQGKYNAAADVAVDMQIAVVNLQQWAEHQIEQSTAQAL
jgi:dihydroxyacetone kinase-like predicted kinase